MYLDITIKQLPQGVIHLFLRRLFFISLINQLAHRLVLILHNQNC